MWKALLLIPLSLVMVGATPASRPSIDVQVASLLEMRATGDAQPSFAVPLRISLSISGDTANVRGIPEVHILECHDDLGDTLRDETGQPVVSPSRADGKLRVSVLVSQPPRRAQQISIKGQVEVYTGGETKTLSFDKLKSRAGTQLSDPLLSKAGLEVSVGRVSLVPTTLPLFARAAPPPAQFLERFQANGVVVSDVKRAGISEVRLLDADGKVYFHTSHAVRTKKGLAFNLNGQSITDATTLQIDVYTGATPSVKEFELKDIRLP